MPKRLSPKQKRTAGKCECCGLPLTDATSVALNKGPVCREKSRRRRGKRHRLGDKVRV